MDLQLSDRRALVTGSTSGIGYAIAQGPSLLKLFTSAEEVANLAVYLCSARASATTGAALRVDCGVVNQIM